MIEFQVLIRSGRQNVPRLFELTNNAVCSKASIVYSHGQDKIHFMGSSTFTGTNLPFQTKLMTTVLNKNKFKAKRDV